MKYLLIFVLVVLLASCSVPTDDRATAVCECYKELHRVNADTDLELMNFMSDSCKQLHVDVLIELEEKPEEKGKFDAAYEHCQNEK